MRTTFLALLICFACLPLAGCKKDAEAKTILTDFDSFTTEMVKRVDAASNPADGVDDAQKYFDSRKTEMTGKMDTLKGLRGYQVGEETKKMMESSLVEDAKTEGDVQESVKRWWRHIHPADRPIARKHLLSVLSKSNATLEAISGGLTDLQDFEIHQVRADNLTRLHTMPTEPSVQRMKASM